jgi:NagD protein
MRDLSVIQNKKGFICDMDGVVYHGNILLPGVKEFLNWLKSENKEYLFLTNASGRTPKDLKEKLARMGLEVEENHFYTSAQATAKFLDAQYPQCTAYVIGDPGLLNALFEVGVRFDDVNPDYVVVGETSAYNYAVILKAVELIHKGAKLIATNSDLTGPSEQGIIPACRALIAPIELATGRQAYYIGKPNPLMMRTGLKRLGVHSEDAVMIGDRMDTDIVAGVETGLETVLVLSGVSTLENIKRFSYQPHYILNGVGDIVPQKKE